MTIDHEGPGPTMKRSSAVIVCLSTYAHQACLYDPARNQTGDVSGAESMNTTGATTGSAGTAPLSVDTERLLATFPGGCAPLGVGLQQLRDVGILVGGDDTPITCELRTGLGMGSGTFGGDTTTMPPGISIEDEVSCVVSGTVSPALPVGIYGFITTFTQSGIDAFVPYCAPQKVRPPSAYAVRREDGDVVATFNPGVVVLDFDADERIEYGAPDPDPIVFVTDDIDTCSTACFYNFLYSFNTLSASGKIITNPHNKFPELGFDGFSHAIRVQEPDLAVSLHRRPFVVNLTFNYCIANNQDDCGNAELIKQNGGGSNYYFSLVVLPK